MSDDKPATLPPIKPEEARRQEADFFGVAAGFDYDLGGGQKWTLPNPSYMPRDMKKRYTEHLRFMNEDLDTENKPHAVTGKPTKVAKWPLRFKGELIDEDELLCIALMGNDGKADRDKYFADGTLPEVYQKFIDSGGVAGQLQAHWQMMNRQMQERLKQDPFRN
jgi:hypothetical protein